MRRGEVVQYGQAFTEICFNRQINNPAGRIGHQPAHASNLANLLLIAARTGISHHKNRVERIHVIHHGFRNVFRSFFPERDRLTITFILRNQAAHKHLRNLEHLCIRCTENGFLFGRNLNIGNSDGHACLTGVMVTRSFDTVKKCRRFRIADEVEAFGDELAYLFLIH